MGSIEGRGIGDHELLRALFAPASAGTDHLLSVERASTLVRVGAEHRISVEHPQVAAGLVWMQENSEVFGVVLRSYTGRCVTLSPGGDELAVQEMRGWVVRRGVWRAVREHSMFNAACTDPETGEPLPPEPATEYRDAWPVIPGPRREMGYGAYW